MPGFSSFSDMINEMTANGKRADAPFYKVSSAPEAAGVWHSLWKAGGYPAAGADGAAGSGTPGAGGTAHTLSDGSLTKAANQDPDKKFLSLLEAVATQDCMLMIYDRLNSTNISLVTANAKNVGSPALGRYAGASSVGVQVWAEVTTITATSAPVANLSSYTDQDGNTGQVGGNLTFPAVATNVDALIGPFPLATGDTGVRSVETVTLSTAGTTGAANIVLLKPLAFLPLLANVLGQRDLLSMIPSFPQIFDGHTLGLAFLASGTAATTFWGEIVWVWG